MSLKVQSSVRKTSVTSGLVSSHLLNKVISFLSFVAVSLFCSIEKVKKAKVLYLVVLGRAPSGNEP